MKTIIARVENNPSLEHIAVLMDNNILFTLFVAKEKIKNKSGKMSYPAKAFAYDFIDVGIDPADAVNLEVNGFAILEGDPFGLQEGGMGMFNIYPDAIRVEWEARKPLTLPNP